MKPQFFIKQTPSIFSICDVPLWFANTYIQLVLDQYTTTSYSTSYMIKIDKSITFEFRSMKKIHFR